MDMLRNMGGGMPGGLGCDAQFGCQSFPFIDKIVDFAAFCGTAIQPMKSKFHRNSNCIGPFSKSGAM